MNELLRNRVIKLVDQTLHVDCLQWYDEGDVCNYILVFTNLGLVKEVHLHTHHINYYLTPHHAHIYLHRAQFSKRCYLAFQGGDLVRLEKERDQSLSFFMIGCNQS